jgi:hypothetical protein
MLRPRAISPLHRQELFLESGLARWLTAWRVESPSVIIATTACYLATGVFAFLVSQLTDNVAWVVDFFQVPAPLLMLWLALLQFSLSLNATRNFSPDDVLRPAWILITCSAGCQLVGSLLTQVLGADSGLNPIVHQPDWRETLIPVLRHVGHTIGGTFRFALLSVGLHYALKAYRQSGFNSRLTWMDWVPLSLMAAYLLRNVVDVTFAIRHGRHPDVWEVLSWPTDPLLGLLLAQGLLLLRSAKKMGSGMIGRSWKAFAVGLFLIALADVGQWALSYGYLPLPFDALIWYLWLPAAGAFACAPAYQLEVIRRAEISPNG